MTSGDGLAVARLDRLTRSLLDFASIVREAQQGGWSLVVLDQGFDLATPNGRAMAGMLAVFAELSASPSGSCGSPDSGLAPYLSI